MKKTFLEHLQEAVGSTYSAEDIFANLEPDQIIEEVEKYAEEKGKRKVLVAFKDWWNELPEESDDRLYMTEDTINRYLKSN